MPPPFDPEPEAKTGPSPDWLIVESSTEVDSINELAVQADSTARPAANGERIRRSGQLPERETVKLPDI